MPWYEPGDWRVLRDAAADPDELEASYDDWLRLSSSSCAALAADGIDVERVTVHADELIRWCREHELPNDAQARARFAMHKR
jgi:hypothetical protein